MMVVMARMRDLPTTGNTLSDAHEMLCSDGAIGLITEGDGGGYRVLKLSDIIKVRLADAIRYELERGGETVPDEENR